jgi:hypothetical protein
MWNDSDAVRTVALCVTGLIAAYSFVDLIIDEVKHRRDRAKGRPGLRKRLGELCVGVLGLVGFLLTWRLEALDDKEKKALRSRIASISEAERDMDRAANAVAQARVGIRGGLERLKELSRESDNSEVGERASMLIDSVSNDYETWLTRQAKAFDVKNSVDLLNAYGLPSELQPPLTIEKVVSVIRSDDDLSRVAIAFAVFRDLASVHVRMFDTAAVERWCNVHPGSC